MAHRIYETTTHDFDPVNKYIDEKARLRRTKSTWRYTKALALFLIAFGLFLILAAYAYHIFKKPHPLSEYKTETVSSKSIENEFLKEELPSFGSGDTVKVNVKVSEGNRERIQTFEGVIIAINGVGVNKTITVRKLSFGVGVERIFPVHAPIVDSIEVIRKGKVRRSKLYYLRDRVGKSAKIKEDRN